MSQFGETLFGGGGFVRWTLTPVVLIFAVLMPLAVEHRTLTHIVITAGLELACIAMLAGFWLPARFGHWAFRGLAALVFLAYAAYGIHEIFFTDEPFNSSGPGASPLGALLGFLFIGMPSLWFALKGRFTLQAPPAPEVLAAAEAAREERLLRPDWAFYEKHLQRPAPAALRELYSDRALVTAVGIKYPDGMDISCFEPLDEAGASDTRDQAGLEVIAFATSDCGDPIYLRPGPTEPDKVYVTYHDDGDSEVFADSLTEMLQRLKEVNNAR